jgi:hypothetical protein
VTTVIKQSDLIILTTSMEVPGNPVNDSTLVGQFMKRLAHAFVPRKRRAQATPTRSVSPGDGLARQDIAPTKGFIHQFSNAKINTMIAIVRSRWRDKIPSD